MMDSSHLRLLTDVHDDDYQARLLVCFFPRCNFMSYFPTEMHDLDGILIVVSAKLVRRNTDHTENDSDNSQR